MRYLKRRTIEQTYYDARSTLARRITSHRVKRCGTCTFEVPEDDITVEDGAEHCPLCVDTYTAQYLTSEEEDVASVKTESALKLVNPPQLSIRSLNESQPGVVTLITDSAGNVLSQATPLRLVRTVAGTVKLIGRRFTALNTFTYPTGITDNSAPVITTSLITLSLLAAGGMATGAYSITMADGYTTNGHVYRNVLAVR